MSIGGVGSYGSNFQNYRVQDIPRVSVEEVRRQEQGVPSDIVSVPNADVNEKTSPVAPRQDAPLEDISLTFNKQDDFGYIGQDSDIHSLDVEKAISDMRKDQVLQQYQYFVGSSRDLMAGTMDGIVLAKF